MPATSLSYSDGNKTYAECRPHYPAELFEKIFERVLNQELAVDVGTGTGQALKPIAERFDRVIAVDCSPQQLSQAQRFSNVEFVLGTAEQLAEEAKLKEASVDLVTVAISLQWFDKDKFYDQCLRVLKPEGCLAAWAYFLWSYLDNPAADAILMNLYMGFLQPYWPDSYQHIMNQYKDLVPGDDQFEHQEQFYIPSKKIVTVSRCAAFISTLRAYKLYRAENLDSPDPLDEFRWKTIKALNLQSADDEFEVEWGVFGFFAKKPSALVKPN